MESISILPQDRSASDGRILVKFEGCGVEYAIATGEALRRLSLPLKRALTSE